MHFNSYVSKFGWRTTSTSNVPKDWKKANIQCICPVFLNSSKSDPAKYRPISLTCVCCKLIKHIISSHLMKHLTYIYMYMYMYRHVFSDFQHAFRKATCRSTLHDLTEFYKHLTTDIHVAVLDFSKAFEVVPHHRLLQKLDFYGIHHKTHG